MPEERGSIKIKGRYYAVTDARFTPGIFEPVICETCQMPRDLELLYDLEEAAAMIPSPTANALKKWLHDHASEMKARFGDPLYKRTSIRRGWSKRFLSVSEICFIRSLLFNPFTGKRGPGTIEGKVLRFVAKHDDQDTKQELIVQAIEQQAERKP